MTTACPQCNRQFDESGGFCPFDGTPLVRARAPAIDATANAPNATTTAAPAAQSTRAPSRNGYISLRDMPSTTAAMQALGMDESVDPYAALIDTTLDGRYRIERTLGEGGMGVVMLGRHTLIEKPVAIKVLKREVAADREVVTRFMQEARAASSIGHPNIVEFTDFGVTPDGLTYSVMEFVDGPTLDRVIDEYAPMPPARVNAIVGQIAQALAAAHEKGIIHRDLKPENVFVYNRNERTDFVKIVDFGIAKVTSLSDAQAVPRLTLAGTVFGTPEYMAPEQAAGRSDIDCRADVYSLGVIAYEMLTGRVPHKGKHTMRTLAMKMLDEPPSMGTLNPELDIDPAIEAVVMRAIARKPEERIASMNELAAQLQAVASESDRAPSWQDASYRDTDTANQQIGVESAVDTDHETAIVIADSDNAPTVPYLGRAEDVPALVAERAPRQFPVTSHHGDHSHAQRKRRVWPMVIVAALAMVGAAASFGVFSSASSDDNSDHKNDGALVDHRSQPARIDAGLADDASGVRDPATAVNDEITPKNTDKPDKTAKRARKTALQKRDNLRTTPSTARRRTDGEASEREVVDRSKPTVLPRDDSVQPRRKLEVKVIPQPSNASLYIKNNYSGKGATTIERVQGTVLSVECRLDGHKSGQVTVSFDGETEVVLCVCTRIKKCIDGIKNPFDDCP